MATAADKSKKKDESQDKSDKPRKQLLSAALIALVAAAAAGGGVWFFTQKDAQPAKDAAATKLAPAQYFALDPAFVVNLPTSYDGPRYLQVEVQLMSRDPLAIEAMKAHAPALRARLLMLFSQIQASQISDRAGREKLQAEALAEVQKVLKHETGKPYADELLFTSFVTQ
ncbi:flagellar basal body-associated FliL family protein [Stenotrophomonas sp. Marseille-Q4652]|uniref:flagellar basal body-associated FliL family protein n=1 Tax=Stenotrophomonas sp. Marseille-Q4652 TaxID=2866595 RepID=UPI001CE434CF|nr:flagellar basal body-associated FliL family protein [Stenotrophomonas sp. Marseille-Q4652]